MDALLPQTQCTRCGYPDCRAYADAIAGGEAPINQCPPGGAEGIRLLARLLGRPELPLNPAFGDEGPRRVVYIEEATCIGCTLCIQACPVDAIVGAPKRMHAVIEADCTGCELCLPVCPMDCIALEDASAGATGWAAWSPMQADAARARYAGRHARLARDAREHDERLGAMAAPAAVEAESESADDPKRAAIAAALARARVRAKARPQ
ncbi:electron transport complex subunit RsxB [Comamonadaceae bacterium BS-T2-15]|uniref:Electron transport complex subunit RsxB n=1 Tax=Scleromatobacter humisilvae TaxID=2897159 RepID=A0A9X1YKB2_9BURK|nr:electron transport complex subunit RsxB [Scleromatobacter humisilvae]MCK9685927.1 electron transport complex subunit RsxB [Scleromatobacter humisilvae]